ARALPSSLPTPGNTPRCAASPPATEQQDAHVVIVGLANQSLEGLGRDGLRFLLRHLDGGESRASRYEPLPSSPAPAVCTNWSRTFTLHGVRVPTPLPGFCRRPAAKAKMVRMVIPASVRGRQMSSNRLSAQA